MNDNLDPHDDLTERLSALGRQPVGSALQSEHLTAMASVPRGASWRGALGSRVKIGAAVLGGFLIGTTGLASAGVLGPLQSIAKTSVEAVTPLEVPAGHGKGAETSKAAKAKNDNKAEDGDGTPAVKFWGTECVVAFGTQNRGQYLKAAKDADALDSSGAGTAFKTARESDCGKSVAAHLAGENATNEDGDKPATEDQGKSADKRKDGDHANANAPTGAPEADDVVETPEAPEAPDVDSEHSGAANSHSGSEAPSHSGPGR